MRLRTSKAMLAGLGLLHGCAQDIDDNTSELDAVETTNAALSTSTPSYLQPLARGVTFTPLLSVGDSVNTKPDGVTPYRMVGIPDGLGAFDNGDGTFTVLMNHELTNSAGAVRAHGAKGSFVSKWTINKSTLQVQRGEDLIQAVSTYNAASGAWNAPTSGVAFTRFCSADLPDPDAFFNKQTKNGFKGQIFMNGEEAGDEGRAIAHVVTGDAAGISYELPHLGKFSHENSVANPSTGDTTLVAGTDDTGNGQVYFYVGTKTKTGNTIQRAGLTNGNLYGLKIDGVVNETDATALPSNATFSLVSLGNVANKTGAQLQAASVAAGVSGFQRPEDAAWSLDNPADFYFVTTASFANKTRLWHLTFSNIANPTAGGKAEVVSDGGDPKMFDNLAVDRKGRFALLQEDPGGNDYIAKIWRFDFRDAEAPATRTILGQFDPDRFTPGAPNFITNDEESSGIIDLGKILGNGYYLLDAQIHKASPDAELVELGQLLLIRVPNNIKQ